MPYNQNNTPFPLVLQRDELARPIDRHPNREQLHQRVSPIPARHILDTDTHAPYAKEARAHTVVTTSYTACVR